MARSIKDRLRAAGRSVVGRESRGTCACGRSSLPVSIPRPASPRATEPADTVTATWPGSSASRRSWPAGPTLPRERYQRIAKRHRKKRAIVAAGRSILVMVWHLLSDEQAAFNEGPKRNSSEPDAGSELFRCLATSHGAPARFEPATRDL